MPLKFKNAKIVGTNIQNPAYHSQTVERGDPAYIVSQSMLKDFADNPWKWRNGKPKEETKVMEFGDLVDRVFLLGEDIGETCVVQPAEYENEKGEVKPWHNGAAVCKAWHAEQTVQVVTQDTLDVVRDSIAVLNQDPVVCEVISGAYRQVEVHAEYTVDGITIQVAGLIDFVPRSDKYKTFLGDFKAYSDASPKWWPREIYKYGLHVQAAMYLDLYNSLGGDDERESFVHIISETVHPYAVGRRWVNLDFVGSGRRTIANQLKVYAECLKTDLWPGYDDLREDHLSGQIVEGFTESAPEPWMIGESGEPME